MRKWLVLAALIAVGLAGILALAVANLDRWLNANKELVAERVESALGRQVSFGEVGLSFRGGLGVRVTDLRVGDDPAYSAEDFVRSEAVDVLIRIWPALFGEIEVGRVVLRHPSIRVIKTAKGLSTDSLGGGAPEPAPSAEEAGPSRALLVALVDVSDGEVRYVDRTAKPPLELAVNDLDVRASDLSTDRPVHFEIEAAVLGAERQNLDVTGTLGPLDSDDPRADLSLSLAPLLAEQALALPPLRAALPQDLAASGPLELEAKAEGSAANLRFEADLDAKGAAVKLGEGLDKAPGVPLHLSLRGERKGDALELEQADLVLGDAVLHGSASIASLAKQKGSFQLASDTLPLAPFGAGERGEALRDVKLDGSLAGPRTTARLRSAAGSVRGTEYRDLAADLDVSDGRIEIQKASLRAWDGELSATGSYDTGAAQPRFDVRTQVQKVRIEQLLAGRAPALARVLSGQLDTQLDVRGAGSTWDQIRPLLNGSGNLRLSDGLLRQFNAVGDTLRAFAAVPALTGSGLGRFVAGHPKLFGAEDTAFRELVTGIQIQDGWVNLPGFLLGASEYELRGQRRGRLSLEGKLDLPVDVVLSQALSEEALAAAAQLRYLRGSDGRVALPVLLRGMPPVPTPDPQAVASLAVKAGSGLLLEKLLPGAGGQAPQAGAPAPSPEAGSAPAQPGATPQAEPPAPTPEDTLIREGVQRGLEGLLGGGRKRESAPPPDSP
jgi:uncharacterized protein involved in outer membrane biogenesis